MRAEDGGRAADHVLIVSVEHPGIDGEGLAEEDAMSARVPKLQRATVGDCRDGDQIAEARKSSDVAKDRRCGRVQDQDGGLELLPEIVSEAVEEAPEHGGRPLEGCNATIVRGGECRDLAADRSFQRNIRQDEYRRPIGSHMLFLCSAGKRLRLPKYFSYNMLEPQ
ncbi:hypothetical protein M2212_006205 [Bradyrhizobium elkanii]|uniref:hypothetical protein n=1 Tax=Bradyrhizobium elkanii TaxID=29448 RepID=UPI00216A41A2|nr:hypothetical protein [Bradyrhizobium elkanii]MCS3479359.1 hypothetical protein [Bradyrhizobium elkanii]